MTAPTTEQPDESVDDLLQQIQARQEQIDSVQFSRPSSGNGRTRFLVTLTVVAGMVVIWDLLHPTPTPTAFDDGEIAASLELMVYLTASGIEKHRTETGALVSSLDEIGLDDPAVDYQREGQGYRLVARSGDHVVTFQDGDDLNRLEASFWKLQRKAAL